MNELFQPVSGKLGQLIFESPDSELSPRLEFFIELEFEKSEFDDEIVKPFFRASSIVVEAKSWRDLENSTHEFPWAPKPGSIDAAVLLFGQQNPADVVALSFGTIQDQTISVSFETEIDFEIEADRDELGQMDVKFTDFSLDVAPLKIATSLAKRCKDDADLIGEAVSSLIDAEAYGSVDKVPGGFEMPVQ